MEGRKGEPRVTAAKELLVMTVHHLRELGRACDGRWGSAVCSAEAQDVHDSLLLFQEKTVFSVHVLSSQ